MLKELKYLIMVVALFTHTTMWCNTLSTSPVLLYRYTPIIEGTRTPFRMPSIQSFTLNVILDDEAKCLIFSDYSESSYTYYICSEDRTVISSGTIDLINGDEIQVELESLDNGTYVLIIECKDSSSYAGTFDL